jgi:hypothetical protein
MLVWVWKMQAFACVHVFFDPERLSPIIFVTSQSEFFGFIYKGAYGAVSVYGSKHGPADACCYVRVSPAVPFVDYAHIGIESD